MTTESPTTATSSSATKTAERISEPWVVLRVRRVAMATLGTPSTAGNRSFGRFSFDPGRNRACVEPADGFG